VCARKHPSDDDRERPRGLADAVSRWDTEQDWLRLTPAREAERTEHVPPPESTPAWFGGATDQRRPAAPPAVDSWDAVVAHEPQAARSADPWAPSTEPEQELWTPPVDTVYRRVRSLEPGLPERWPSQADAPGRTADPNTQSSAAGGTSEPAGSEEPSSAGAVPAAAGRSEAVDEAQQPAPTSRSVAHADSAPESERGETRRSGSDWTGSSWITDAARPSVDRPSSTSSPRHRSSGTDGVAEGSGSTSPTAARRLVGSRVRMRGRRPQGGTTVASRRRTSWRRS